MSNFITKTDLALGPQLGSQMGQYAGMYSISNETGLEHVFIDSYLNVGRGVKLFECFNIKNRIVSDFEKKVYTIKPCLFDSEVYKIDRGFNYDILGSFDVYHSWHKNFDTIKKIFDFKSEIKDKASNFLKNIKSQGDTSLPIVSIHFRRTDYLKCASLNLSFDYYAEASQKIIELVGDVKFLLFSDDISWVKNNVSGENTYYSENNSNYVDMCIMTMCDHNIIANSTFSWWGAYLNRNKGHVICPFNYIGKSDIHHSFINGNYFPENWISIHKE